jgi:hypothetical protein
MMFRNRRMYFSPLIATQRSGLRAIMAMGQIDRYGTGMAGVARHRRFLNIDLP